MKALTTWPWPRPRPRGPRWHRGLHVEHKSLINMGQYMHSRITTHKFNICLHLTNKEFQRRQRQEARQHVPVDTGSEDTTPSPRVGVPRPAPHMDGAMRPRPSQSGQLQTTTAGQSRQKTLPGNTQTDERFHDRFPGSGTKYCGPHGTTI